MKKDLLRISELSRDEIEGLLRRAIELKSMQKKGISHQPLAGKTMGMIFEKSSTRTRVSFEVGMMQLGGNAIFLSPRDTQIGRGEPVSDSARVLSRYLDGIMIRTYSQEMLEEFAKYSGVPVINGLTDLLHPCQVLTDLMTIKEKKAGLRDLKIAWIGDGNNMANSWIAAAARLGFELSLATPASHRPDSKILEEAERNGAKINLVESPLEAAKDADVINTDVWASMGQEEEYEDRKRLFASYQVNSELLTAAKSDAIVMHCLPAHRGEEITDEVMEGPQSVIFDQAENRLHLQKAILEKLLG
ncbi:MAG: ornithine carbamoyltransferase [Proteobacteria bacterium]|nr:ornithine carbamoyltransferase [Pseudomonadota bacterium]